MPSVAIGLLVVIAIAVAWRLFAGERHDAPVVIEIRGAGVDGVHIRGGLPGLDAPALAEFVASLELATGARIWAVREDGRFALRFAGVPEGPAQRLRNFVYARY